MSDRTTRTWHVDDDALRAWVDGTAGQLVSASVEQHLLTCERCRDTVTAMVGADELDTWDGVLAAVEVPAVGPVERLLIRLGVSGPDAKVLSSAPALHAAWVSGLVVVIAFVTVAATFADVGGLLLFLLVAPLVPVVGVAASYGPGYDPSYEVALVSPYATVRMVLLRAAAVLLTSVPLVVLAGLPLPGAAWIAVAWLLPAAGFIAVVLTAGIWVDPMYGATVVAVGWVGNVLLSARHGDPLAVFAPVAMALYAGVLVVAVLVLLHRLLSATPSWRLR